MTMDEISETVLYDEAGDDSTEALLNEYEDRKSRSHDDVISMQTAVCLTLGALFLALHFLYPETAEALLNELKKYTTDTSFVVKNPIDIVISYFHSR